MSEGSGSDNSSTSLRDEFRRFVCQTSPEPLGIVVSRARGATVRDVEGNEYLDLLSGIGVASVGHCNPEVVAAVRAQAERYLHVMVYGEAVLAPQVRLARRLGELAPGDLSVTYFTNSGTEAIEGAIKLARKFTGARRLVAFQGSFHGDTIGALSLGGNPVYRAPFEPLLRTSRLLPFDDLEALARDRRVGRGASSSSRSRARPACASRAPSSCRRCARAATRSARCSSSTRSSPAWAAPGSWFAVEHGDVPSGRSGSGQGARRRPAARRLHRTARAHATLSHDPPLAHVTTFGGHPLSCAAGLAALEFAERERLPERAAAARHVVD